MSRSERCSIASPITTVDTACAPASHEEACFRYRFFSPTYRFATQVSRGIRTGIKDTPTSAEAPRTRSSSSVQPRAVSGAAQRLWKNTTNSRNLDASLAYV